MTTFMRLAALALLLCSTACTVHEQPAATGRAWTPESIVWTETNADGTKYALLEGSREKGSFTYAFFIPAGVWDAPHWHSADARVVVVRGQMKLGYGDVMDTARATVFDAGAYLLVPAHARHFDGADVDTIIIGTASGPWKTEYVRP